MLRYMVLFFFLACCSTEIFGQQIQADGKRKFVTKFIETKERIGSSYENSRLFSYATKFELSFLLTNAVFRIESDHPDIGTKEFKYTKAGITTGDKTTYSGELTGVTGECVVVLEYSGSSGSRNISTVTMYWNDMKYFFYFMD